MVDPNYVYNGLALLVFVSLARARDLFDFSVWIFMLVDTFFNFETFMLVELNASRYTALLLSCLILKGAGSFQGTTIKP